MERLTSSETFNSGSWKLVVIRFQWIEIVKAEIIVIATK